MNLVKQNFFLTIQFFLSLNDSGLSHFSVSNNQSASLWFHNQYESDATDMWRGERWQTKRPLQPFTTSWTNCWAIHFFISWRWMCLTLMETMEKGYIQNYIIWIIFSLYVVVFCYSVVTEHFYEGNLITFSINKKRERYLWTHLSSRKNVHPENICKLD